MSGSYKSTSGNVHGDISSTTAVIAAATGTTYSIRTVLISCAAAAEITIEQSDGTDMIGPLLIAENGGAVLGPFLPGAFKTTSGNGINAISSGADHVTVTVEAYVH